MTAPLLPLTGTKRQSLCRLLFVALPALLLLCLGTDTARSTDDSSNADGEPALVLLPASEHPAVCRYLPGSKRTIVAPAWITPSGEITLIGEKDLKDEEEWNRFVQAACERARLRLATLDPQLLRDEHGVVQMAAITSESPTTASLMLLQGFLGHFSAVFGPELLLSAPSQNKICIFPKLANHLPQMASTIRDEYLISPTPASTEIFELSRKGLRAVGSLDPNDN